MQSVDDLKVVENRKKLAELGSDCAAIAITGGLTTAVALEFSGQPVVAQSAPGISEMQSGATAIGSLSTTIIPIAVGIIVFSCGALVIKRLLFS